MKVTTQSLGVQSVMQDLDFKVMAHAHNALTTHGVMELSIALFVISHKTAPHAVPQMDCAQNVQRAMH